MNLERRIYYFFSLKLVRLLEHTKITPDQVTILSFLVVLVSAIWLATADVLSLPEKLGLFVLLNLSNVLDAVDGQLARHRRQFSRFGWILDLALDQLKQALLVIAVTVYLLGRCKEELVVPLGMTALFLMFFRQFLKRGYASGLASWIKKARENPPEDPADSFGYQASEVLVSRLGLGLFTVGEFYLLLSFIILLGKPLLFPFALIGYLSWIIWFEFVRTSSGVRRLAYYTRNDSEVAVFGAGAGGMQLARVLEEAGLKVGFFVDNSPEKQGEVLEGKEIRSPDDIGELPVVVSSEWYREILGQLDEKGIEKTSFIVY